MDEERLKAISVEMKAISAEMAAYCKALGHHAYDRKTVDVMRAHIDKLQDELMDVLGLPEGEKTRLNAESEAAVDEAAKRILQLDGDRGSG